MVAQAVAGQLPREADRQGTFPKPPAALGMQEEHGGFPRRFGDVLSVLPPSGHRLRGGRPHAAVAPLIGRRERSVNRSITAHL